MKRAIEKPVGEQSLAAAAPLAPRRSWYRLHLSTWLMLPLGLIAAVLVVLPGGMGHYPERVSWIDAYGYNGENAIVHGWPLPFLWRHFDEWQGRVPSPAPLLPWAFAHSVREFRLLPLVADSIVGLVVVVSFAAAVEWRRRRRRAGQFTLRELLLFATAAAVCFGWLGRQRAADAEFVARLSRADWIGGAWFVPRLPLWLRACFGDKKLEWFGVIQPTDETVVNWHRSQQQDIERLIDRSPQKTVIRVAGGISDDDAAAVAGIDVLERLQCSPHIKLADLARLTARLRHHPRLCEIYLDVADGGNIGDAEVAQLATIPRLRSLEIVGDCSRVTERGIAALKSCVSLEVLELDRLRLTSKVVDSLGEIRQLRRLNLSSGQFTDADTSPLRRLDALEELELWGTNSNDNDARQLRGFPALRCLDVANTQMTHAGIKELLDPSAGFAARRLEQFSVDADFVDGEVIAAFKRLPRLHLIKLVWGTDRGAADPLGVYHYYAQLIQRMEPALPGRDIISGGTLVVP